jgi:hypothetical protein
MVAVCNLLSHVTTNTFGGFRAKCPEESEFPSQTRVVRRENKDCVCTRKKADSERQRVVAQYEGRGQGGGPKEDKDGEMDDSKGAKGTTRRKTPDCDEKERETFEARNLLSHCKTNTFGGFWAKGKSRANFHSEGLF